MKKYLIKKKKNQVSPETASMKSTLNVSADKVDGANELEVDSKVKLEVEGKVIEERIDIYSKPQKKIFVVLIDKMKVM
jgi:hypothetical protein